MLYSGSKQIFSHLHLPLALHQRGGQLLVFLQEGLPQLCSQDQVRVQPSAAVTGAGGRRGRREREGQGHGWGQRKEGVLQAGGGETGCPRSEHLGRAQSANITAAAGGRWDEGLLPFVECLIRSEWFTSHLPSYPWFISVSAVIGPESSSQMPLRVKQRPS